MYQGIATLLCEPDPPDYVFGEDEDDLPAIAVLFFFFFLSPH